MQTFREKFSHFQKLFSRSPLGMNVKVLAHLTFVYQLLSRRATVKVYVRTTEYSGTNERPMTCPCDFD